uniref:Uncharacterized protein n=1 Tax=Arion vulgaris TaxID=1028688 RepID=A0A0B6YVL2_9EUPU
MWDDLEINWVTLPSSSHNKNINEVKKQHYNLTAGNTDDGVVNTCDILFLSSHPYIRGCIEK